VLRARRRLRQACLVAFSWFSPPRVERLASALNDCLKSSAHDCGSDWKRRDVLLELLLVCERYLCKYLKIRDLEARGVEPLSLRPSFQTSTCVADRRRERVKRIGARHSLLCPRNNTYPRARSPRFRTSLLSSHPALAGVRQDTSRFI